MQEYDITTKSNKKRFRFYYENNKLVKIFIVKYTSQKRQYWDEYYFNGGLVFVRYSILDFNNETTDPFFNDSKTKYIIRNIYINKNKIHKVLDNHEFLNKKNDLSILEEQIFTKLKQFYFLYPALGAFKTQVLEGKGTSYGNLILTN